MEHEDPLVTAEWLKDNISAPDLGTSCGRGVPGKMQQAETYNFPQENQ